MSQKAPTTPRVFPWAAVTLALLLVIGTGLTVAGVYELAGRGWAFIAGAVPCLALAAVILRGLRS